MLLSRPGLQSASPRKLSGRRTLDKSDPGSRLGGPCDMHQQTVRSSAPTNSHCDVSFRRALVGFGPSGQMRGDGPSLDGLSIGPGRAESRPPPSARAACPDHCTASASHRSSPRPAVRHAATRRARRRWEAAAVLSPSASPPSVPTAAQAEQTHDLGLHAPPVARNHVAPDERLAQALQLPPLLGGVEDRRPEDMRIEGFPEAASRTKRRSE